MKKSLLLAALLLSSAAQADNFVCTVERNAVITPDDATAINYAEAGIKGASYFIDTLRGYRLLIEGEEEAWYGECAEFPAGLFNCKEQNALSYSSLSVKEKDGQLRFLQTNLIFGMYQSSTVGTCLRL
ncbi:hypothetical protein N9L89_07275 [Gammaproteobacteria bacterium]|nr:hypothetical protein [Gammaproteobacteria bacterium]